MSEGKPYISYRQAGVDIDAGNELVERIKPLVARTRRPEVLAGLGGFGGLFALDTSRYRSPVLVSGTDGVGTKLLLARQLDRHEGVGIDLVAMCVNDILAQGAEPLFFLDYFACGKLETEQAAHVIGGIAAGCEAAGCALIGGETAEMPGLYGDGEYDLAGFVVGVVERERMITGETIEAGDHLLGLASSGPHSNGYSLIRRILQDSGADPSLRIGDTALGDALIAPTRIYVNTVRSLIDRFPIHGVAHITGGGLSENIIRVVADGLALEIDSRAWPRPPVFTWLADQGPVSETEMLRTFNCGIGMVLIVPAGQSDAIRAAAGELGETVFDIGRVVAAQTDRPRVQFIS